MFIENYNESELLSLMLNKDEFFRYITQQYNKNNCCTQLEPLIWAIHLNIPKYQRLPLLENILLQSMNYMKMKYSFLPEKQITGKTYEVLGIPTVCGEPDKHFLNAYKKYKLYYPVRCAKNEKTFVLNKNIACDSIRLHKGQHFSKRNTKLPLINQKIISSTPILNKVPNFKINFVLSPIKKQTKDVHKLLSTDLLNDKNSNSKNAHGQETSSIPMALELSGFNTLNTSPLIFSDEQNYDVTETSFTSYSQSPMYFTNQNLIHNQVTNNIPLSNDNDLTNMLSRESLRSESKDENSTQSIYFDNLNKVECKVLTFKTQKKKSTQELKQSLSEKIEKNLGLKHSNKLDMKITTDNIKIKKPKIKRSHTETKMNELLTRKKQILNDYSFSDLDETSHSLVTMESSLKKDKCHNKTKQESFNMEYNDTWIKNINHLSSDFESSNYNSVKNMTANTSSSIQNLLKQDENVDYSVLSKFKTSSSMSSNDSISLPNLKSDRFDLLETIQYKYMEEQEDSCDS